MAASATPGRIDPGRVDPGRVDHGRRRLLIGGLTAGGGFLLGLPAWAAMDDAADDAAGAADLRGGQIGFFVEIRPDNAVVIGVAQPEIGQGVRTSMPMLVAEELDVEWSAVGIRQMPLGILKTADGFTWKYGGQGAGGSTSVTDNWTFLRQVGATARRMLIRAAAERWEVGPDQCRTEPGVVICDAEGRRASYAELAAAAAALPVPEDETPLKDPAQFRIIGTGRKVVDAEDIVTGRTRYGIDTVVSGMRYAVIERSPWLDGRVESFDDSAARKVPGVTDIFTIEGPQPGEPYRILASGVAVVATSTWAAMQGREALKVRWSKGPHAAESTAGFWRQAETLLEGSGQVVRDDGDFAGALQAAAQVVTARYRVPFVSHAPMEPQNCFAHVREDGADIIAPTQMPGGASRAANEVTGLPRENIAIEMTRVGGGFGRRLTNDYVAEAVMVSQHLKGPVQLVWTREDDLRHDFYRPSGLHEMKAALDSDGRITAWTQRLASAGKYYRREGVPPEEQYAAELYVDDFPAGILPNLRLEWFDLQSGMPRGSWRAPAHTANAFAVQSFLDEIAHAAGRDPLELRLELYGPSAEHSRDLAYGQHGGPTFNPWRLSRLLQHVAGRIGYGEPRPKGRGVGLAAHFTFGGYAAHAVEVSVDARGKLRVERIVAAADCGLAVNPLGVEAQLQGGTIDGLSTALNLAITLQDGQVVQSNFHDYRLLGLGDVPVDFEAHVLPPEPAWANTPTGMGEMGIPTLAPALTNAIFNACGVRIRELPIGQQLERAFTA